MNKFIRESRIAIVAEMAQSYEGSLEVAGKIATGVCQAGVDAVMFQVVYADELAVMENNRYDLFRSLELSADNWKLIIDIVHKAGGLAFGEIFGKYSADVVLEGGIDGLKIHAADINNIALLRYVGKTNLPILLSIGGSSEDEIGTAIKVLQDSGDGEIILMHGYQLCPTSLEDTHFLKIRALSETFGLPVGYGDHIAGCVDGDISRMNPLALTIPLLAVGTGAKVIEKHVILHRKRKWEDHESALTPEEFIDFVALIRNCEKALGEKNIALNDAELAYRVSARKYIVAAFDLKAGTTLTEEHLAFKRIEKPEEGIVSPLSVLGKKLRHPLRYNNVIKSDNLI